MINLSLEFDHRVVASEIPEIISAARYAHSRGAVIVAAAGNYKKPDRAGGLPRARADDVIAVGATTPAPRLPAPSTRATAATSTWSRRAAGSTRQPSTTQRAPVLCRPETSGSSILQETFLGNSVARTRATPQGYDGTSMASPHVAAIAALLIATHRLGEAPHAPEAVQARIQETARDLGRPGSTRATAGGS